MAKHEHHTLFGRIFGWIGDLFSDFPDVIKTAIHIGVSVTEAIKNFVESETADVITKLIPGDIDDTIRLKLRATLPKILIKLKLAEDCSNQATPDEIVACAIKTLQSIDVDFQSAFLHDLSILIAQAASDGELSWSDGVMVAQWYYEHKFKK